MIRMDIENFIKLLRKIERKYGWKNHMMNYMDDKNVKLFKYVLFNLDTRDMTVWSITFRIGGVDTNFNLETKSDIKEMYAWLNNNE